MAGFFMRDRMGGMNLIRGHHWRFSLRAMLLGVLVISILIWIAIQFAWIRQRKAWRTSGPAAARSTQGQSPPGLLQLFGEQGESWIEIKNGTKEQIAEAKRLFPEATVVVAGEVPGGTQAVPAVAPVAPQAAAEK
jgi:hypothetical protein